MVGVWTGDVRVVQAGGAQVAKGGMEISEVSISVTIDHQDQESFMGRSRTSQMSNNDPSVNVWGTIRSTGKEAIFITSNGARGQMWLAEDHQTFEFCITNLVDGQATAYCADLSKARDTKES
jgi:hypothetical protein